MKKLLNYAIIFALLPFLFLASCSDDDNNNDDNQSTDKFTTLKEYLVNNNMDIPDVLSGWIIDADQVNAKSADEYYFIDIRQSADYNSGHINGAVNSTLGNILDAAANADKPIVVVCYTGQTAGHAVLALRLSGYSDAKVLKWGMSGWNSGLSSRWNDGVGNVAIGSTNWAAAPGDIAASVDYNKYPTITSSFDDGANILNERIQVLLSEGFNGVSNTSVLNDPLQFCINNFWDATDVEDYGNIKTSYRIKPLSLAGDEIKNLNPDKQVVTYCWTGQTSSMMTAYLKVLGYDAVSLTFGANGMIYDNLTGHKWSVPTTDYPIVQN
jgi:rhodanese-related sulfurtransferase